MPKKLAELQWLHESLGKQIDREFDLLGQRMNWLFMSAAFLFTALAICLASTNFKGDVPSAITALVYLIPLFGIFISAISFGTMSVARSSVAKRKNKRYEVEILIREKLNIDFDITVHKDRFRHRAGNVPYILTPITTGLMWIYMIFVIFFDVHLYKYIL